MQFTKRHAILAIVLVGIVGAILYIQRGTASPTGAVAPQDIARTVAEKAEQFPNAQELAGIAGYINTNNDEIVLADLIGKKVILVDFWTYSCINCQRTTPYLNAWYEQYKERGLEIVGVHTPEFEFEKIKENVQAAVEKFGIQYPVVQDNEYATWRAYGNRYWPRKYLIDIDGYIVYDHIGEGGYAQTEQKIRDALEERAGRLAEGSDPALPEMIEVTGEVAEGVQSPEIYFGAGRNTTLGNGSARKTGTQHFTRPSTIKSNTLYLVGDWDITEEYAEAVSADAAVLFRYEARRVFTVASAQEPSAVIVIHDQEDAGSILVAAEELYRLIDNAAAGAHLLELQATPGVRLYTFTFG